MAFKPRAQTLHFERFSAEDNIAQGQRRVRVLIGADELPERAGGLIQNSDAFAGEQFTEFAR